MHNFARAIAATVVLAAMTPLLQAQSAQSKTLYNDALLRERSLRREFEAARTPESQSLILTRVRALVGAYEDMSRLFPASGYSDNALWQGAVLAADAFWQFGDALDRTMALRLFSGLTTRFPSSTLAPKVASQTRRLEQAKVASTSTTARPRTAAQRQAAPVSAALAAVPAALTGITRELLPEVLRIVIQVAREVPFYDERIEGPSRVFLDLQNTRAVEKLRDAVIPMQDEVVKQVRVGTQPNSRTRVVLDLKSPARYSVYTLYDPYRIVVDFERKRPPAAGPDVALVANAGRNTSAPVSSISSASDLKLGSTSSAAAIAPASASSIAPTSAGAIAPANGAPIAPTSSGAIAPASGPIAPTPVSTIAPTSASPVAPTTSGAIAPASGPPTIEADIAPLPPAPPAANVNGGFSLSRQLGLGVARIVIDPGHGGHDPGAKARGLTESDLVLDVALRLEELLKDAGVEVLMTRRNDTFIALEERTAIANRAGADLFLSIHSNASTSATAQGVETYFLNFAVNPEAEAVAARENAGGARTMRNLPDIVRAIALNNKIDESRDFASMVQTSLHTRLQKTNRTVRNLGVKQAPFMVLVGATMPSILAEISFITNRQEAALLKTDKYKQQIAEALFAGVLRYQQALKKAPAVASSRSN
jgi:N-acetylmuramoyl-L-alanine amidase